MLAHPHHLSRQNEFGMLYMMKYTGFGNNITTSLSEKCAISDSGRKIEFKVRRYYYLTWWAMLDSSRTPV